MRQEGLAALEHLVFGPETKQRVKEIRTPS
jgi:hypothetical protein